MEDFVTTVMDADGRPHRRMAANYMAHFSDTETKEFHEPHITVYRAGAMPWQVQSQRGWISAEDDVLRLLGPVHIWRNKASGEREMTIQTRDLRVLPDADYAETEHFSVITTARSQSSGDGMRAYLGENRLELVANVKSTFLRRSSLAEKEVDTQELEMEELDTEKLGEDHGHGPVHDNAKP